MPTMKEVGHRVHNAFFSTCFSVEILLEKRVGIWAKNFESNYPKTNNKEKNQDVYDPFSSLLMQNNSSYVFF